MNLLLFLLNVKADGFLRTLYESKGLEFDDVMPRDHNTRPCTDLGQRSYYTTFLKIQLSVLLSGGLS